MRDFNNLAKELIETYNELPLLNVGVLQDVPTATFIVGEKGETIMAGGCDLITGFTGPGNSFKSTLAMHFMLSILDRYASFSMVHDTEINMKVQRIINLSTHIGDLHKWLTSNFTDLINLSSKSNMYADEWFAKFKKVCDLSAAQKLITWDGMGGLKTVPVSTGLLDSISEAESKKSADMLDVDKDDTSTSTYYMRTGLFKSKMVTELPRYCFKANNRLMLTAHISGKIDMEANKYNKPDKALSQLKDGEAIKGVSSKFNFLISTVYKSIGLSVLKNSTTRLAEYPSKGASQHETDLYKVKVKTLRCKSGATGLVTEIVVSQSEGVLNTLTEFEFLKQNKKFGFSGNDRNYAHVLLPEVKLQRTSIRPTIDENAKLRRAINISSELLQLHQLRPNTDGLCTVEELHASLIEKGYDWDDLLETRGWYHPNNYDWKKYGRYLSIIDFLNIRLGTYTPFWKDR